MKTVYYCSTGATMPFVIHCPACRYALAAHESYTAYVIHCPACHAPFTVPPTGMLTAQANAFDVPEDPPRPRPRRRSAGGVNVGWVLLGLFAAVAVIFLVVYSGDNEDRERREFEYAVSLERAHKAAVGTYNLSLQLGDKKMMDEDFERILKVESDYASVISRHPKWGKSALTR